MGAQERLYPSAANPLDERFEISGEGVLHLRMHMGFRLLDEEQGDARITSFRDTFSESRKKKLHLYQVLVAQTVVRPRKALAALLRCIREKRLVLYLLIKIQPRGNGQPKLLGVGVPKTNRIVNEAT